MQDTINDATILEAHGTGLTPLEADKISLQNQKTSSFLRLPAEIRNAIYANVLQGHRIDLDGSKRPLIIINAKLKRIQVIGNILSITKTCRQTHSESALLFFGLNEFGGADAEYGWSEPEPLFKRFNLSQLKAIKYWWCIHCHVGCVSTVNAPVDRLPSLQRFALVARIEDGTYKEHIKILVDTLAGRDVEVVFEDSDGYC